MKDDQTPKEEKYGLIVCSIIGRRGSGDPISWVKPILNHSIENIKDKNGNGWKEDALSGFLTVLPCKLSDVEKTDEETISKEELEESIKKDKHMPPDWEKCNDNYTYRFPLLG